MCVLALLALCLVKPIGIYCQSDSLHVGFILANLYHERWWNDKENFKQKFNELGGRVTFIDCFDMAKNQFEAAEKLIDMRVDCIVIIPVDATSSKSIVDMAHASNIPVIAYDRLILGADVDLYATVSSTEVGEMMANSIVDNLDKGTILYLGGPSDDFNSTLVRKGVFNVLDQVKDQYEIYSIQATSWNELVAYMVLQDFVLNKGVMPDAVICAADMLTYGALDVIRENNKLGKVLLTGQDAELEVCRQIIKGNVLMTVYKSNVDLANAAAVAAWHLIKKEKFDVDGVIDNKYKDVSSVLISPVLINKDNVDKVMVEEVGVYKKEELYK